MSQDNENQDLKTIWAAIIEKVSPTQKATFVLVANPGIIFFSLILVIVFKTSWLAIPVALVATAATFWVTRGLRTIIIELEEKIYSLRTENEDKQKRLNNFAELIKKNGGGKPSGANGAMIDE